MQSHAEAENAIEESAIKGEWRRVAVPIPMLKKPQEQAKTTLSASKPKSRTKTQFDMAQRERLLRKKRSSEYMNSIHKLDAGGHVHNRHQLEEILNQINTELPDIELEGYLLGIVSKCYLGVPYEVHSLDYAGGIITHYKRNEPLPNGMEKARSLAMRGGYQFIEVYTDKMCCVDASGRVSIVQ